jgi:hypothetical protein
VSGILTKGFQAKTTSQTLFVSCFSINSEIIFFADSILFGSKSVASILVEMSRAITISIQFFEIVSLLLEIFGFAKSKI